MFGVFRTYRDAKAAQKALTEAFKARGHDFMTMHSTVHEALVKECMATGVEETMKHFDYVERHLYSLDDFIHHYKERSKNFTR